MDGDDGPHCKSAAVDRVRIECRRDWGHLARDSRTPVDGSFKAAIGGLKLEADRMRPGGLEVSRHLENGGADRPGSALRGCSGQSPERQEPITT